jgi:hypothetical protein
MRSRLTEMSWPLQLDQEEYPVYNDSFLPANSYNMK